jgi:hypothetical protein
MGLAANGWTSQRLGVVIGAGVNKVTRHVTSKRSPAPALAASARTRRGTRRAPRRVGGTVEYRIGVLLEHAPSDRVGAYHVELGMRQGDDLVLLRLGRPDDVPSEHPAGPVHEQSHGSDSSGRDRAPSTYRIAISALSPTTKR